MPLITNKGFYLEYTRTREESMLIETYEDNKRLREENKELLETISDLKQDVAEIKKSLGGD